MPLLAILLFSKPLVLKFVLPWNHLRNFIKMPIPGPYPRMLTSTSLCEMFRYFPELSEVPTYGQV